MTKNIWDVYTALVDNLGAMFYSKPTVNVVGNTAVFFLYGEDAKCVTTATLKRWMKKAGIEAECVRIRDFSCYQYIVKVN